ncbi:46 kDa FK506-binding nuclear protein-like [Centruroides vittatus]|uniref:46 kDa FK506-binding nuclear protein-like n=1 Tax=Centruroides vittatus TaxID=120091 RepID=UPI00350EE6CB
MFWGVTIRSDKPHRETVTMPFHVSMASLVWNSEQVGKDKKCTSVILKYEGRDYVLCTLEYGKVMCVPLDLVFDKGERIRFHVVGSGSVHLSGFVVTDTYLQKDCSESSTDEFEESYSLSSEETYPSSSESESVESTSSSSDDTPPKQKKDMAKDRKLPNKEKATEGKKTVKQSPSLSIRSESNSHKKCVETKKDVSKRKAKNENEKDRLLLDSNDNGVSENAQNDFNKENEIVPKNKTSEMTEEDASNIPISDKEDAIEVCGLSAVAVNSCNKIPKITPKEKEAVKRSSSVETPAIFTSAKKKKRKSNAVNLSVKAVKENTGKDLKSNVIDTVDIEVGNGPVARKGKLVHICYLGYLSNGEEFISVRNRPFSFRLGNDKDVVKGLNSGIEGMRVGGKRKITVPPSEGFGNKTVGSVPPNSRLIYEVELKAVS